MTALIAVVTLLVGLIVGYYVGVGLTMRRIKAGMDDAIASFLVNMGGEDDEAV